jgi:site-specific DNA recombinase
MTEHKGIRSERARRPNYLLSGLLKCGACGGGFSKISQSHYGCSTARNKGTCDNLLAIRRDKLEATVLDGLKHRLMQPELVTAFVDEFHREINRGGPNKTGAATAPRAISRGQNVRSAG